MGLRASLCRQDPKLVQDQRLLQAASPDVTYQDRACFVDKEYGKCLLLASWQDAYLGAKGRKGKIPITTQPEDLAQSCIAVEVELRCVGFHLTVFGFPKHGKLYLDVRSNEFG